MVIDNKAREHYNLLMGLEPIADLSEIRRYRPFKIQGTITDYEPSDQTPSRVWYGRVNVTLAMQNGESLELMASYRGVDGEWPYATLCEFLEELEEDTIVEVVAKIGTGRAVSQVSFKRNIVHMLAGNNQYFVKGPERIDFLIKRDMRFLERYGFIVAE